MSNDLNSESVQVIAINIDIRRGNVDDIRMPVGCSVHVYNHNRKWSDAVVEPDQDGVMCKQTIYSNPGKNQETPYKFELVVKNGVIARWKVPQHIECNTTVRTYDHNDNCVEQKIVKKK